MTIDLTRIAVSNENDLVITHDTVGKAKWPILIIDNFYKDPDYIRSLALALNFQKPSLSGISHPHSTAKISLPLDSIFSVLEKYYSPKWFKEVKLIPPVEGVWNFALSDRLAYAEDNPSIYRPTPHVDPTLFAGVAYLTPDKY